MLYLDIAVIAGELAGLVFSTEKNGWWGQFVFYTQCSNYLLLAVTAIHLFYLLRRKAAGASGAERVYADSAEGSCGRTAASR